MPNIRPSSDLRNKYNEISEFCHKYSEPVYITKNGTGDLAVMSIEVFEKLVGKFELFKLLNEGIEAMKKKGVVAAEDVFKKGDELEKYAAGWLKRRRADEQLLQERHAALLDRAGRVASMLRERFGARKVILFGSVATGRLRSHSDLDLAVLGLPEEQYLEAFREASELVRPYQLDLVPVEMASAALRNRLAQEGVEL